MATRLKKWPKPRDKKQAEPTPAEKPESADNSEQADKPAPKKKYTFGRSKD